MTVVADSGAIYALYDAGDRHHRAVAEAFAAVPGPVIVPMALLAEADFLLRRYLGIDAELDFLRSLEDGAFLLEPFTDADVSRVRELVERYRDLDIGVADAAVVATAERLNTRTILTVDKRHFRALRHRNGSAFVLWPADLVT
ncbi:MAG TPA: PIN domain-containing protein [Thermoanaerobaculia bacterium]|nr:PIN domain-containing protein [Thermoanaerobaculia bacterium]